MEMMILLFGLVAGSVALALSPGEDSADHDGSDTPNGDFDNPEVDIGAEDTLEDIGFDDALDDDSSPVPAWEEQPQIISGTMDSESLSGGSLNDIVASSGGDDIVVGGQGDDLLDGRASAYVQFHHGTYVWDDLADSGTDNIYGGDGNDTLGVADQDVAYGGDGSDLFEVYNSYSDVESYLPIIEDFQLSHDRLSLVIEDNPEIPGDAIGDYLGGGTFTLDLGITTVGADDGEGVIVCVDGSPVVILSGLNALDTSLVDLQVFIGSDS